MKVAILSAGPSLLDTFDPDTMHDLRIGVNRAAGSFACDWWSCGDGQTFREHVPIGYPVLFTMTHQDGQLKADSKVRDRVAQHRVVTWGECSTGLEGRGLPPCWSNWSISAAVALAVWRGGSRIDIYGHDSEYQAPDACTDVAGFALKKRVEIRHRVVNDTKAVINWARLVGIKVNEIRPDGEA